MDQANPRPPSSPSCDAATQAETVALGSVEYESLNILAALQRDSAARAMRLSFAPREDRRAKRPPAPWLAARVHFACRGPRGQRLDRSSRKSLKDGIRDICVTLLEVPHWRRSAIFALLGRLDH